jgi:fluoride exporter
MPIALAVALGGAAGSLLRWWVATALTNRAGVVGMGTFAVNITGAFALGLLLGLIETRWTGMPRWAASGIGIGILGGYTTFSSYMVDAIRHVEDGRWLAAGVYLFGTLALGVVAAVGGLLLGRAAG